MTEVHDPLAPPTRPEILCVEDEPLNAMLLTETFRRGCDWLVHVVRDGAEAMDLLATAQPALALVDMNLPDTTGIALLPRLRAACPQMQCIALSADTLPEQIDAALAAGFEAYWTKPIDLHLLVSDIAQRMGWPVLGDAGR